MKIWHKILVPPLVAIVFLLALGAVSVALMARQGIAISTLIKNRGASVSMVIYGHQDMGLVQSAAWRTLSTPGLDAEKVKAVAAEQRARLESLAKRADDYRALASLDPAEREIVTAVPGKLAKFRQDVDNAFAQALTQPEAAKASLLAADAGFQELSKTFSTLAELQTRLSAESSAQGAANFRNMLLAILGIALFAAAAALATAILMGRRVVKPMRTAMHAAREIARGDLSSEIVVRGKDETADLLRAQHQMKQDLRKLVSEVVAGARSVADTSAQIAQGNQDLSQRTEMQASTLEETASSMEELTATVHQSADNARQASELAVGASEVARKGGEVVGQVVSTMSGISGSSKKIADIIGVIDGIAFQTNILALNAAVEAARAGEQGRGFAVVAAEVRTLAQRSAEAAKEIKALIGNSVQQVEAGTRLVDAAGATMQEIVASVTRVSDLIAEIAAASQEQSSGIAQVNTAITQMDGVVQQNATLVEEAAAAAESLKQQAGALLATAARFNVGGGQQIQVLAPVAHHRRDGPMALSAV